MSFALGPDVSAIESDDGMVLLHEGTGRYWMLNPTGAAVVRLLQEGRETADVIDVLSARFSQDPARVAADVEALMTGLAKARLVTT